MKLEELHAITDKKKTSIFASLSLARVRSRASVRGIGGQVAAATENRASRRAAKYSKGANAAYGHIYSGTVDPAEVARRRKANKVARKSRKALRHG